MTIRSLRVVGNTALVEVAPRDGAPTVIPAPLAAVVAAPYAPSGGMMYGTSYSSTEIAVGTQTFTMNEFGLGFIAGQRVRAAETANPTLNWMDGAVVSYAEPTLTLSVDNISLGAIGPFSDWSIGVQGARGATGATGAIGPAGPTGQVPEAPIDAHYYARHQAGWSIFEQSPTFTGVPLTPTPPLGDNSQAIANTAFIKLNSQPLSPELTSLAAASSIGVIYYRSAVGLWGPVTVGAGLSFSGGTLGIAGGGFAPIASPVFTGDPQAPTPASGDNDNSIATTAFVVHAIASGAGTGGGIPEAPTDSHDYARKNGAWNNIDALFAPLASPVLTGTPTAPSAAAADSSNTLATTSFVHNVVGPATIGLAPLASPALTGTPTAPTPPTATNDVTVATCAYVGAAIIARGGGIPDAPTDTYHYGRQNAAWSNLDNFFAAKNNANLTGNPQAPTPASTDSTQSVATTAFVQAALAAMLLKMNPQMFHGGIANPTNAWTTTPATNSIDLAAWSGADSTGTVLFQVPAMTKLPFSTWAVGTGAGGMGPGITVTAKAWFHMYAALINGQGDFFFDNTLPPTHMPPNTTAWRRVMSFQANTTTAMFRWRMTPTKRLVLWWTADQHQDYSGAAWTALSGTLASVPPGGLRPEILCSYAINNTATPVTDDLLSPDNMPGWSLSTNAANYNAAGQFIIRVDANNRVQGSVSSQPSSSSYLYVQGWYDPAPDN